MDKVTIENVEKIYQSNTVERLREVYSKVSNTENLRELVTNFFMADPTNEFTYADAQAMDILGQKGGTFRRSGNSAPRNTLYNYYKIDKVSAASDFDDAASEGLELYLNTRYNIYNSEKSAGRELSSKAKREVKLARMMVIKCYIAGLSSVVAKSIIPNMAQIPRAINKVNEVLNNLKSAAFNQFIDALDHKGYHSIAEEVKKIGQENLFCTGEQKLINVFRSYLNKKYEETGNIESLTDTEIYNLYLFYMDMYRSSDKPQAKDLVDYFNTDKYIFNKNTYSDAGNRTAFYKSLDDLFVTTLDAKGDLKDFVDIIRMV